MILSRKQSVLEGTFEGLHYGLDYYELLDYVQPTFVNSEDRRNAVAGLLVWLFQKGWATPSVRGANPYIKASELLLNFISIYKENMDLTTGTQILRRPALVDGSLRYSTELVETNSTPRLSTPEYSYAPPLLGDDLGLLYGERKLHNPRTSTAKILKTLFYQSSRTAKYSQLLDLFSNIKHQQDAEVLLTGTLGWLEAENVIATDRTEKLVWLDLLTDKGWATDPSFCLTKKGEKLTALLSADVDPFVNFERAYQLYAYPTARIVYAAYLGKMEVVRQLLPVENETLRDSIWAAIATSQTDIAQLLYSLSAEVAKDVQISAEAVDDKEALNILAQIQ